MIIYYSGDRNLQSYPERHLPGACVLLTYIDIVDPRLGTTRTRFRRIEEGRRTHGMNGMAGKSGA